MEVLENWLKQQFAVIMPDGLYTHTELNEAVKKRNIHLRFTITAKNARTYRLYKGDEFIDEIDITITNKEGT